MIGTICTLRDWLALLYLHGDSGAFQVLWTDDIMAEFHYHLRKNNPLLDDAQVGGIRRRLEAVFSTGRITDYVTKQQLAYHLSRNPNGRVSLPDMLVKAGAPQFADRIRKHLQSVDVNALRKP